jgi:metal-responsive CopG/Arc/MetJ family transcriptional regulator
MTATAKLAISLPAALAKRARKAARAEKAPSFSAYVADALEQKVRRYDLGNLIDEMLAETGGPMTAEERRRTERELGIKPKVRRKK